MTLKTRLFVIPSAATLQAEVAALQMTAGEAVIFCASVRLGSSLPAHVLCDLELQRGQQLRFEVDRQRYHVAHVLKRVILGHLLGRSAAELTFATLANGKPVLADQALYFNLSHSGNWVALAVRLDAPVGVDIEQQRTVDAAASRAAIAHPGDCAGASAVTQEAAFYRLWTLKEAVAKCDGRGLAMGLRRIRVTPRATSGQYVCATATKRWQAWAGQPAPNTHLAVACAD